MSDKNRSEFGQPYELNPLDELTSVSGTQDDSLAALVAMGPQGDPDVIPPGTALGADGRLDDDISCRVCGYNLRGVDPHGVCPECGTAIGWSLVGDLLKFSDPAWVRSLLSGTGWILASIITTIVAVVLLIVFAILAAASSHGNQDSLMSVVGFGLVMLILPTVLAMVGHWMVTKPEPVERDNPRKLRVAARWLAMFSGVLGVGTLIFIAFTLSELEEYALLFIIALVLVLPLEIASLVTLFLWAKTIALRIPDKQLASHTTIVMWGLVIHELLDTVKELIGPVGCVSGLLALVFVIWGIVLVVQYRNRLRLAAEQAERSWVRHSNQLGQMMR